MMSPGLKLFIKYMTSGDYQMETKAAAFSTMKLLVCEQKANITTQDVAEHAGVTKRQAMQGLNLCKRRGFVEKSSDGSYKLTESQKSLIDFEQQFERNEL